MKCLRVETLVHEGAVAWKILEVGMIEIPERHRPICESAFVNSFLDQAKNPSMPIIRTDSFE
jgi:hypothetical protein